VLVICQISLAMMLLVGAGLLVRSAILLQHVPPGFDSRNLLVSDIGLPGRRYPNDSAAAARFDEILRDVSAVPGVASAALVSRMPIIGGGMDCNFRRDGSASDGASFNAQVRVATPSFFETLRLPILRGRNFSSIDAAGSPRVAIINRRFAHKLFGDEDAIGHRITCSDPASKNANWLTIVAISGDVHAEGLASDIRDQVYSPLSQSPQHELSLVVRGAVPVLTLAPAVRRTVAAMDPLLPLGNLQTMDEAIASSLAVPRFTSQLLSALGVLGLVLAVIGIYGVIAFFVAQRTHEIGIRMALGANTSRVLDLVLRQGVILAIVGIAIGAGASLLLTGMLDNLLYGITARDPVTFVAVAVLLALVSLTASFLPARRASRVDPLVALRDS
jgi:putative ABC transport system permease protein